MAAFLWHGFDALSARVQVGLGVNRLACWTERANSTPFSQQSTNVQKEAFSIEHSAFSLSRNNCPISRSTSQVRQGHHEERQTLEW